MKQEDGVRGHSPRRQKFHRGLGEEGEEPGVPSACPAIPRAELGLCPGWGCPGRAPGIPNPRTQGTGSLGCPKSTRKEAPGQALMVLFQILLYVSRWSLVPGRVIQGDVKESHQGSCPVYVPTIAL